MKLPNMNEFSPGVVSDLGPLLQIVAAHSGSETAISEAIATRHPRIAATADERQRLGRARNVQIGMSQCGLFDLEANELTPFGQSLRGIPPADQYARFAAHLLSQCNGNGLLDVVRSLQSRRERVSGTSIRQELRERGFRVTTNEGNASKVRLWLQKANAVDADWNINETVVGQILGIDQPARREWERFSRPQKILLKVLRQLTVDPTAWFSGSHVKDVVHSQYGLGALPEGSFRASVLNPLRDAGWLETRGERRAGGGRGGNMGEVRATAKLLEITADLGLDPPMQGLPPEVIAQLDRGNHDLQRDVEGTNTYEKGLALEVLSVKLTRHIGLTPVTFRLRASATGGNEVDLIADGQHLHYSRWLVQCKATQSQVSTDVLAREIGMALLLKAHVVLMISTGGFSEVLKRYADQIEQTTALQVVLIDGETFRRILTQGAEALVDALHEQARAALLTKRSQVLEADAAEGA